jgi:hypothetical protein
VGAAGAGATAVTVTVAVAGVLLPPVPEQVSEKVALAINAPVACVPLAATAPLQAPDAVQAVALVEVQVSIEEAPLARVVGAAINVTVGAGTTVGASAGAEPPPPQALVSTAQVRSGIERRIRVLERADASLPWRARIRWQKEMSIRDQKAHRTRRLPPWLT